MPATNRKRIREVYFYKMGSGDYKIELVDGRNNLMKEQLYCANRNEINQFLETLQADENKKFEVSALGIQIYNKKPEHRLLTKVNGSMFDTYVKNLSELKENKEYRAKVSNLLRGISDLLDDPEDAILVPAPLIPAPPITPEIPPMIFDKVSEDLGVVIEEDMTFLFQDQKWQLTKDGFEHPVPAPRMPLTAHNIQGSMEYMANLLQVNHETGRDLGDNSFRFPFQGGVYRITHIYTGDHNTLQDQ